MCSDKKKKAEQEAAEALRLSQYNERKAAKLANPPASSGKESQTSQLEQDQVDIHSLPAGSTVPGQAIPPR